jgi:hypothetical protein
MATKKKRTILPAENAALRAENARLRDENLGLRFALELTQKMASAAAAASLPSIGMSAPVPPMPPVPICTHDFPSHMVGPSPCRKCVMWPYPLEVTCYPEPYSISGDGVAAFVLRDAVMGTLTTNPDGTTTFEDNRGNVTHGVSPLLKGGAALSDHGLVVGGPQRPNVHVGGNESLIGVLAAQSSSFVGVGSSH